MLGLKNTDWLIVLHHDEEGDDDDGSDEEEPFFTSFALRQWLLIKISVWIFVWCHL